MPVRVILDLTFQIIFALQLVRWSPDECGKLCLPYETNLSSINVYIMK